MSETAPLIFIDTETTGLQMDADIWEFAAIRRSPDGTSGETLHLFIKHEWSKCSQLPPDFYADHVARFPSHDAAVAQRDAAQQIRRFLRQENGQEKPIWVGSAPDFDASRVERLVSNLVSTWSPEWDHQLIGVVPLMLGYLASASRDPMPEHKSEALSRAIGVDPDQFERHTALGDVLWTMAIYDRVMGADHA